MLWRQSCCGRAVALVVVVIVIVVAVVVAVVAVVVAVVVGNCVYLIPRVAFKQYH